MNRMPLGRTLANRTVPAQHFTVSSASAQIPSAFRVGNEVWFGHRCLLSHDLNAG